MSNSPPSSNNLSVEKRLVPVGSYLTKGEYILIEGNKPKFETVQQLADFVCKYVFDGASRKISTTLKAVDREWRPLYHVNLDNPEFMAYSSGINFLMKFDAPEGIQLRLVYTPSLGQIRESMVIDTVGGENVIMWPNHDEIERRLQRTLRIDARTADGIPDCNSIRDMTLVPLVNIHEGIEGPPGNDAWRAELANVIDGERVVQRIIDWHGGTGIKPEAGAYLGPDGETDNITIATNIRGIKGETGSGGGGGTQPPAATPLNYGAGIANSPTTALDIPLTFATTTDGTVIRISQVNPNPSGLEYAVIRLPAAHPAVRIINTISNQDELEGFTLASRAPTEPYTYYVGPIAQGSNFEWRVEYA